MSSTNWDTDRKRRRPPAWDPPKLLLVVVSGLDVVVGTSRVVAVVFDGGVWLLGSNVWLRHPRRRGNGGKGEKATVSTHPKYSQARSYTTYVRIGINWNKAIICGLNCRKPG